MLGEYSLANGRDVSSTLLTDSANSSHFSNDNYWWVCEFCHLSIWWQISWGRSFSHHLNLKWMECEMDETCYSWEFTSPAICLCWFPLKSSKYPSKKHVPSCSTPPQAMLFPQDTPIYIFLLFISSFQQTKETKDPEGYKVMSVNLLSGSDCFQQLFHSDFTISDSQFWLLWAGLQQSHSQTGW